MVRREEDGGQPVDRPREFEEGERRRRKEEKVGRWFRKEQRGTNIREGVIIIPPTPEGVLAKALKRVCEEELKDAKKDSRTRWKAVGTDFGHNSSGSKQQKKLFETNMFSMQHRRRRCL